jgi:restriction system protein
LLHWTTFHQANNRRKSPSSNQKLDPGDYTMIKNNPTNVKAAFEILLEEIEAEIDFVNGVGVKGFEAHDYERAKEALEQAATLTAFREKVTSLIKEWKGLEAKQAKYQTSKAARRDLGRLGRGLRTREEAYYAPILATLAEMGGRTKMSDVLPAVEKKMKSLLKKVDYEVLASDPEMPRWRNTAQWARKSMVKEGLLKPDSPRGIWEISEAGRQWLGQQK